MNIENINKLIEHLRYNNLSKKTVENRKVVGFNMAIWGRYIEKRPRYIEKDLKPGDPGYFPDYSGHGCGTTACLAGHIYLMEIGKDKFLERVERTEIDPDYYLDETDMIERGAKYLDVSYKTASKLFGIKQRHLPLKDVTLDEAIAVLENLKVTGRVNWGLSEAKGRYLSRFGA